jgi:hypothetical protein
LLDKVALVVRMVRMVGQELLPMLVLVGYTAQVVVAATAAAAMVVPAVLVQSEYSGVQVVLSHPPR